MSVEHYIALSLTEKLGPRRVASLLSTLGPVKAIFALSEQQWQGFGFPEGMPRRLVQPDDKRVQHAMAWEAVTDQAHILTWDSKHYPSLLREIADPPLCLYVQGNVAALSLPLLAVVGSRSATSIGLRKAQEWSCALGELGVGVVSGLALGIDGAAHRGALLGNGLTVAVLATGVDVIYPASHASLAESILAQSGVLVSEQALGVTPARALFPRRNRIISGLSLGTLVIEAGLRSGSLITASQALTQNREVLAMPGSVDNTVSKGCHALLREGAALVESVEDIMLSITSLCQKYNLDPCPAG